MQDAAKGSSYLSSFLDPEDAKKKEDDKLGTPGGGNSYLG
jgi:hypothetical protein